MEFARASLVIDLMDHSTAITPLPDAATVSEELPDKISAYYSLVFPNFTYYVQTISISIGRRSVRPGTPSSSDQTQVDVDLGPLKSVSRLHARIEYEEDQERFVLVVLGRNGAWVDGIWSGSGSRVPLGARSQVQIATRVFDFVLPPPPAPEDSPSPSSPSSTTRHLSPSIDVTSLSPDSSVHSPFAKPADSPSGEDGEAEPPDSVKSQTPLPLKPRNKKRKKPGETRPPPPAVMPPRPQFTYAQLCYRAITALGGKATLQEICIWIGENYDWYRYNEGSGWESSVRHNLSSNRAFKKMERCAGERGKGFFWSVDPRFERTLKDQEGKGHAAAEKHKVKNQKLLEPPLKRSVRMDSMSPLPPSLVPSAQVAPAGSIPSSTSCPAATTGVRQTKFIIESPIVKLEKEAGGSAPATAPAPFSRTVPTSISQPETAASNVTASSPSASGTNNSSIPRDIIPIVVGSVSPPNAADASSGKALSILDLPSPPIAFKDNTIVLNPTIFSSLTPIHLKELESLGAKKAIEILQTYIVRFIKEKRKAEKGKKKKDRSKKKRTTSKERGAETDGRADPQSQPSKSIDPDAGPSSTPERLLSPTSGMIKAVEPLRISSPPPTLVDPTVISDENSNEEIDILGDSDEPVSKKRRVEGDLAV